MLASILAAEVFENLVKNYFELLYLQVKNVLIILKIFTLINTTWVSEEFIFEIFVYSGKQIMLYKILEL